MSKFPRSVVSDVVELVERTLREDPALSSADGVKTWWFGTSACEGRPEIHADALPALLVSFSLAPAEPMDEASHKFPLLVRCELYHAGLDCRDTFDFWCAVVRALFPPGSNAVLNLMRGRGAFSKLISGPVPEPHHLDAGIDCSYATGEFRINCQVLT